MWLQPGKLGMYQQYQEEESRELLLQLLREPKNFRFECDRYSINMLFRAIYGTRLGSSENRLVCSMFKVWETVYLCMILPQREYRGAIDQKLTVDFRLSPRNTAI